MIEKGRILNDTYEIIEPIGEGGAGQIFLAWHKNLEKKVVVKKIKENYVGRINERGEADILKRLHHQYLPQVYDFLQMGNEVYTVIDYIDGNTLMDYIDEGVRFDEAQIVKWLKQLCEALDYLHSQNPPIIHGDIKPSNVMVDVSGNICLIDFNISFDESDMKKISGYTAGYASPEQVRKVQLYTSGGNYLDVHLDAKSDIFSLGATIYHLMTTENPIKIMSGGGSLWDVTVALPYSQLLKDIIGKALKRNPAERYQRVKDMYYDLDTMKIRDKRYKSLIRGQIIFSTVFIVLLLVGLLFIFKGYRVLIDEEFEDKYERIVKESERDDNDKVISDALDLLNDEKYSTALEQKSEEEADLLFMIANEYFEDDEYENAISFYEKAIRADDTNPEYFRDYAIAEARIGEIDKAKSILDSGMAKGLTGADLYLVNAEIESEEGNLDDAITDYKKVLDSSKNTNVIGRAYILYSRAYRSKQDLEKARKVLEEGYVKVDDTWRLRLLREEGSVAIQYLEENGKDSDWIEAAKDCFNTLINSDRYTFNDRINYAILLKMNGEEEEGVQELEDIKKEYPDEYKIPLRQAMFEIEIQSAKDEKERDYDKAEVYYLEAEELYSKYRNAGDSDEEMQNLENIIQELRDKGWLASED